jgi:hypothetical protein
MSSPANDNTDRPHQSRRVQFNKRVHIRTTLSVYDMSQEEINAAWCQTEDIQKIGRREQKLQNMLATGSDAQKAALISVYGVQTLEFRQRRSQRIRAYKMLILSEQEQQWELSLSATCDPEHLASLSCRVTRASIHEAHMKAVIFSREVRLLDDGRRHALEQQLEEEQVSTFAARKSSPRRWNRTTRKASCEHRRSPRPSRRTISLLVVSIMVPDLDIPDD